MDISNLNRILSQYLLLSPFLSITSIVYLLSYTLHVFCIISLHLFFCRALILTASSADPCRQIPFMHHDAPSVSCKVAKARWHRPMTSLDLGFLFMFDKSPLGIEEVYRKVQISPLVGQIFSGSRLQLPSLQERFLTFVSLGQRT